MTQKERREKERMEKSGGEVINAKERIRRGLRWEGRKRVGNRQRGTKRDETRRVETIDSESR